MRFHTMFLSLAAAVGNVSMALHAQAQQSTIPTAEKSIDPPQAKLFDAPVRLKSGDEFLGSERLYPSPVVVDLDNDGVTELVIGDLFGRLTLTEREKISSSAPWGKTTKVMGVDGKEIKFSNW